jgi:hypothetical protein
MPSKSLATSPWIKLARLNVPIIQAAAAMQCSKKTAAERLEQAHAALGQLATPLQADAVALLQASGVVRQEISRRSWQDVLLGFKHAA